MRKFRQSVNISLNVVELFEIAIDGVVCFSVLLC
jgi:hypothetical protein